MKKLRPILVGLSNQYPYQDQSGEINYYKYLFLAFKSLEICWREHSAEMLARLGVMRRRQKRYLQE
ncbi:hypothetical protein HQN86_24600 [Pedobacter panaciterrae]|uniref:hypothetical protein n=1 Tax=Pedobacter panaciterrae TaxID=363849 RepID=UPI00155DDCD5|nr:hypothetical protein [Pedobacter panaciterrae]NQX56821.1 hypothetical protein [Pedobacter panaciterrae]